MFSLTAAMFMVNEVLCDGMCFIGGTSSADDCSVQRRKKLGHVAGVLRDEQVSRQLHTRDFERLVNIRTYPVAYQSISLYLRMTVSFSIFISIR